MAQLYSQTLQALDRIGATLQANKALDIARRQAATEGELSLAKLGMQKTQMEQGNQIALANLDRQNADAAKSEAWREKEYQMRLSDRDFERDKYKKELDEKQWMGEAGNFEQLYRASMLKQGMDPKDIAAKIEGMRRIGSVDPYTGAALPREQWYGEQMLNTPTTRQRMYDVLGDLPRMQSAYAAAARAAKAGGGGSGGGSASERVRLNELRGYFSALNGAKIDANTDSDAMRQARGIIDQAEMEGFQVTQAAVQDPENPARKIMTYSIIGFNPEIVQAKRHSEYDAYLSANSKKYQNASDSDKALIRAAIDAQGGRSALSKAVMALDPEPEEGSFLTRHTSAYNPNGAPGNYPNGGLTVQGQSPRQDSTGSLSPVAPKGTGPNLVRVGQEVPKLAQEGFQVLGNAAKTAGGYVFSGPSVEYGDVPVNLPKLPQLPRLDKDTSRQNQNDPLGLTTKPPRQGQGQDRIKFANDLLNFVNQ